MLKCFRIMSMLSLKLLTLNKGCDINLELLTSVGGFKKDFRKVLSTNKISPSFPPAQTGKLFPCWVLSA